MTGQFFATGLGHALDRCAADILLPLAIWTLLNGVDDLFIDCVALLSHLRRYISKDPNERTPAEAALDSAPPLRMAVFVALWKEHSVIRRMLENNLTRLRYQRVEFFVGAYPNDPPTLAAIREAMANFPNVHLSVCPHPGPTSKADCLNWIYQRMREHETQTGQSFDAVLTHDAEDLMDPDALRWINYYAQWNDFVQLPVLALPTPIREIAHGVYCDDFAESQFKDMMARQLLGGFIPSNGVGTAFSRRALHLLAAAHSNRIFEPSCLTEDYENGFRVRRLGLRQKFVPIILRHGRALATREYFPRTFSAAVLQRSRWITGIALQSWEFHSFSETLRHAYWFWRDRRSLIGNLVAPLANLLFLYGAVTWAWCAGTHAEWTLARKVAPLSPLWVPLLFFQVLHTVTRMACSARIYGWRFACAVPLRQPAANFINCLAALRAIFTYTSAKLRRQPLRWQKTDHKYPGSAGGRSRPGLLGELLIGMGCLSPEALQSALADRPQGMLLGEYLLRSGLIGEDSLYRALARQHDLPLGKPEPAAISLPVTRALPAAVARRWRILPFRIAAGELFLAGSDLPGEEMRREIRRFSSLEIRFQLVTPSEFAEMARQYLFTGC